MKTTNRLKFNNLTGVQKTDAKRRALIAGFDTSEIEDKLFFKVVNSHVEAFSETDLKDQPFTLWQSQCSYWNDKDSDCAKDNQCNCRRDKMFNTCLI